MKLIGLVLGAALVIAPLAAAEIRTVITFADGSVEVCPSSGFSFEYAAGLGVSAIACAPDVIFRSSF